MEELFQKIQDSDDQGMNFDLSGKIQRRIFVFKLHNYLFLAFSLLIVSFIFLANRAYALMLDNESLTVAQAFVQDFEFSFDYLGNLFSGLNEVLPVLEISLWTANVILLIGLAKVIHRYRRALFNV
jgi:hypothetical protein